MGMVAAAVAEAMEPVNSQIRHLKATVNTDRRERIKRLETKLEILKRNSDDVQRRTCTRRRGDGTLRQELEPARKIPRVHSYSAHVLSDDESSTEGFD